MLQMNLAYFQVSLTYLTKFLVEINDVHLYQNNE